MKRIFGLILALSILVLTVTAFVSCTEEEQIDFYGIIAASKPTKTTTYTVYTTADGESFSGEYVMQREGSNFIFDYEYERLRTVEEAVLEETDERIKVVSGVVYYRNGEYSTDGEAYRSSVPTVDAAKLNLKAEYLKDIVFSDSDRQLSASMTAENAVNVLGTDLAAEGDISITVITDGTYAREIMINYTTQSGATASIRTSYSYSPITLEFPSDAK